MSRQHTRIIIVENGLVDLEQLFLSRVAAQSRVPSSVVGGVLRTS